MVFHSTRLYSPTDSVMSTASGIEDSNLRDGRKQAIISDSFALPSDELTSEDTDDEVFPRHNEGPLTRSYLRRQQGFRRKKITVCANSPDPLETNIHIPTLERIPAPSSPSATVTSRTQLLHKVLPLSRPLVPQSVDTTSDRALILQDVLPPTMDRMGSAAIPGEEALPYFRPKRLSSYRVFYNSKRPGGRGRR